MKLVTILSALTTILICSGTGRAEVGKLRMHVINVGQAESILIEMPHHAVLIDAGGEETTRDVEEASYYKGKLRDYLDAFFTANPDLHNTLYAVVLSHPHKDHTKYLEFILRRYTVQHFIEGGHPSGVSDLIDARKIVKQKGIQHIRVKYDAVNSPQLIAWAQDIEAKSGARVRFLSGRRGCNNENNDSLVMRIDYGQQSLMLTGDSQVTDEKYKDPTNQGCGGQLPFLLTRYKSNLAILDADVYKVGHHGAKNGTYDKFLAALTPEFAVISAGNYQDRSPGGFHGWQHAHPNEETVRRLERYVSGNRKQPVEVVTMTKVKNTGKSRAIKNRRLEKDIYCTCWGTKAVVVTLSADGTPIDVDEIPQ